jgi:2-polyprenyl-3-methyl-5-hydroxy-6-metoxy-1,4-benzoquinol methylase
MPLFSQIVSRISPSLLRSIRLNIFIDRGRIRSALPDRGTVVELGCGYGHITSWLAELRPDLTFVGVDIDEKAIAAARRMWRMPNVRFDVSKDTHFGEPAALVMLLHVLHHVPEELVNKVVSDAGNLLSPGGKLLVEEMDHLRCGFGVFLDTHVSHAPPIVRTDEQLRALLEPLFSIQSWERFRYTQIGRVRILAEKRAAKG